MADYIIPDSDKIHSYVTWPESEQIFDDGRGGLAFPDQNNSGCTDGTDAFPVTLKELAVDVAAKTKDEPSITESDISFTVEHSNVNIVPDEFTFAVASFTYDKDTNPGTGTITVAEETLPDAWVMCNQNDTARLVATTVDTLECTNIVSSEDNITITGRTGNTITFQFNDNAPTDYIWNDNVIFAVVFHLSLDAGQQFYAYLNGQTDKSENGVYLYTAGSVTRVAMMPVPDVEPEYNPLSDATINDNVPCCKHYRKSYSHREVYDRVYNNVGELTGFGVKSFASKDCDGGLVDWFTTNGSVNLGNGHESVYVQGFGLGEMYIAKTPRTEKKVELPKDTYDETCEEYVDETTDTKKPLVHPLLTWAYGTRFDSRTDMNLPALPRDWPFTYLTGSEETPLFNQLTDTNNITLVKHCSAGVGNLERDREDNGEDVHVFNNRHHIVLYPEYSAIQGHTDNYKDGSVIVKPLFIHLPATLDTKDGETVDITVSIQNVDQDAFGDTSTLDEKGRRAALSGYYAAMKQPRVYVLGGVQKFSNKKLPITYIYQDSADYYTINTSKPAYSKTSELLPAGTEIRANIIVSSKSAKTSDRSFVLHGTIISNTDENGLRVQANGKFPYDIGGRGWNDMAFTVCGIAYLEEGDNPTDTPMGLDYRNYSDDDHTLILKGDSGDGETPLTMYNKFYSRHDDDSEKGSTVFPLVDKRYVLATVYQTATSTFPWAMSHRRKLATLHKSWTDELYRDRTAYSNKSLMHMVYEENAKLYSLIHDRLSAVGITDSQMSMISRVCPISYMAYQEEDFAWKSLGSVIRVEFPWTALDNPNTAPQGNPVRQARKAVQELTADFYNMRLLSYKANTHARVKVNGWQISGRDSGEETDWTDELTPLIVPPTIAREDWAYNLLIAAWCCTIRSLPDYVLATDFAFNEKEYSPADYSTILNVLFTTVNSSLEWYDYLHADTFPYNKRQLDYFPYYTKCKPDEASACTDESGVESSESATVTGKPSLYKAFSENSVIKHYDSLAVFQSYNVQAPRVKHDMCRYAETVLSVKIPEETYMHLANIKLLLFDNMDTMGIKDWMNPFTNIQSIDAVPVPTLTDYPTWDENVNSTDFVPPPDEFYANDPAALYRKQLSEDETYANDPVDSLSTVMPTDSDVAKFLESYVTAYAAELPKHMYQGTRILCQDGVIPDSSDDPIYIRAIDRVRKRMFTYTGRQEDPLFIKHYINDNFASISTTTRDPNVDRVNIDQMSLGMSLPPYVPQNGSNLYKDQTYTRVIMQFTFSQKAGRWYTTGYRQYPTNYLSPLYGADALSTTCKSQYDQFGFNLIHYHLGASRLDDNDVIERPLWINSACAGYNNYRNHMYAPYSVVPPMDITLGCVPYLVGDETVYRLDDTNQNDWKNLPSNETAGPGRVRVEYNGMLDDSVEFKPLGPLEEPFKPIEQGGLGLYPPSNLNGGYKPETNDGIHANFWSVHRFIRPAVSVLPGTDIPSASPEHPHTDGRISDPTLYRMFDFPAAGYIEYKLPDVVDPDNDTAQQYLAYHIPNAEEEDGLLASGPGDPGALLLGYGIDENELNLDGI